MRTVRHCHYCGTEIPVKEAFCPRCGQPMERPLGVLIISVLSILGGVMFILGGAATIAKMIIAREMFKEMFTGQFPVLSMMMLIIGIFLLVVGTGLWKLKMWGWLLAVIGLAIGIGNSIYGLGMGGQEIGSAVPSIIISFILVGYLVTKRKYFFLRKNSSSKST